MFEILNLEKFGKYLYELRTQLSYSQNDVRKLSGISIDTLRRIERGKVLLRYDTLIMLSQAYKKDLLADLKNYSESDLIFHYYKRLDKLILKQDTDKLTNLCDDFHDYTINKQNEELVVPKLLEQFELLLEGLSLYMKQKYIIALKHFFLALNKTNSNASLDTLFELKYNSFEIRILLLIGLTLAEMNRINESNEILHKCLGYCNFDEEASFNDKLMILKIYMNLSYNAHIEDEHELVIKYANLGIEFCNENHINYMMSLLLFRKGLAEYYLGYPNYLSLIKRSITLLLITDNEELATLYANSAINKYGFDVNINEL